MKPPIHHITIVSSLEGFKQALKCQTYSYPKLACLGIIEAPHETPHISQHYLIEGFNGALNWAPIITRDSLGQPYV